MLVASSGKVKSSGEQGPCILKYETSFWYLVLRSSRFYCSVCLSAFLNEVSANQKSVIKSKQN
jgi:hypothetical protein